MKLNEFLNFRLGVVFEDAYNVKAAAEVLSNKEKYPLTAEFIEEGVDYETCDSGWFDCDDVESCAGFDETMELYRAFVCAWYRDCRDRPVDLRSVSFGVIYLNCPSVEGIMNPGSNYSGRFCVQLSPRTTGLKKEIFVPCVKEEPYLGAVSKETTLTKYPAKNAGRLKLLAEQFMQMRDGGDFFANNFTSGALKKGRTVLDNGVESYPVDCYEFDFGDSFLRFFSTERGFDVLSIIRETIIDSLSPAEKSHPVFKEVERVGYHDF